MEQKVSAFIHCDKLEQYPYPAFCPFNTSRAGETFRIVKSIGLLNSKTATQIEPRSAERTELKKFHTSRYLHVLKQTADGKFDAEAYSMGIGTPDCPAFKGIYEYGILNAGATLTAAKLILDGRVKNAFNPSGGHHHAMPERASGFCYINDVALACLLLADAGKRVLYLDVDVHHADGVQYAVYDRSDVMTISFHQTGKTLFPGTGFEDEIGSGAARGYNINVPLPVGTYDAAYMKIFGAVALPLIKVYQPDVIVFELGTDGLAGDPLANLCLTNNTYADILRLLQGFDRPILMTGGGGYNIENTVRAWAYAWSVLSGTDSGSEHPLPIGGVMIGSTDWQGGLRDMDVTVTSQQISVVEPAIDATIEAIKKTIFPIHGL